MRPSRVVRATVPVTVLVTALVACGRRDVTPTERPESLVAETTPPRTSQNGDESTSRAADADADAAADADTEAAADADTVADPDAVTAAAAAADTDAAADAVTDAAAAAEPEAAVAAAAADPEAADPEAVAAAAAHDPDAVAADAAAAAATAPARDPHRFLSLDVDDDVWMARVVAAQPTRFKPVGTSSLVFKTSYAGGLEAAFRPRTRTHARGWLNEVAAYRVARALDMDQVPPAVSHAYPRAELQARLHADFAGDWPAMNDDLVGRGDAVWGALVFWVPGLRDLELDTPRGIATWTRWLAHDAGVVTFDEATLAGDLATMLCFDYLIANVDRWSGGNVRADRSGSRVVIRDHNLAFLSPLPRAQHERVLGHARRVERFSRRFVVALRSLDEAKLRASLAADPATSAGSTLLDDAQIRGVLDRRLTLLSRVASLLDAYGESAVLAFP